MRSAVALSSARLTPEGAAGPSQPIRRLVQSNPSIIFLKIPDSIIRSSTWGMFWSKNPVNCFQLFFDRSVSSVGQSESVSRICKHGSKLPLIERDKLTKCLARINLPWTADFFCWASVHFHPVGNPSRKASHCE